MLVVVVGLGNRSCFVAVGIAPLCFLFPALIYLDYYAVRSSCLWVVNVHCLCAFCLWKEGVWFRDPMMMRHFC